MFMKSLIAGAAIAAAIALSPVAASAATFTPGAAAVEGATAFGGDVHSVQHRGHGHYGHGGHGYRGGPVYRGGPAYRPGPVYRGGPGWGHRPWGYRPYYGTIIGGIAIGTIIAATAYGVAPPRPRPDMCWYWTDEDRVQGYWDYC